MSRRQKSWAALAILLAILLIWWGMRGCGPLTSRRPAPGTNPAAPLPIAPATPLVPAPVRPLPSTTHHPNVKRPFLPQPAVISSTTASPAPVTPQVPAIKPSQAGMHTELIPKEVSIVRCYYDQDIVAPETTFGFDINGSGFNEAFHQMITVDMDALDVQAKNLRLVTANQIHGEIEVGPEATTQYVHPKILIRRLPVFKAEEPFGVVRHGEVLDVLLVSIDDTGQAGRFRIITNLDNDLMRRLHVTPTTPKLEVGTLIPQLPFKVDGELRIAPGLSSGEYGLVVSLGTHPLLRKDPIVDVVRPDVGRTGSVSSVKATVLAHRPGDVVNLTVQGSGFAASDTPLLNLSVNEFDMGQGSFTYLSPGRIDISLPVPANAPVGTYGITLRLNRKTIYERKSVFGIVPPNWLSGVNLPQPLSPGQKGIVQILGRDISPAFSQSLHIETDDPGLQVSGLRLQDPATVVADVQVSTAVAPGDYLLHIAAGEKKFRLPSGSIIKINP